MVRLWSIARERVPPAAAARDVDEEGGDERRDETADALHADAVFSSSAW